MNNPHLINNPSHGLHKLGVISSCANSLFQVTRNARELATGALACDRPREGGNPVGNSAITYNVSSVYDVESANTNLTTKNTK